MKIEAGRTYLTRDGDRVIVKESMWNNKVTYPFSSVNGTQTYTTYGEVLSADEELGGDLVKELTIQEDINRDIYNSDKAAIGRMLQYLETKDLMDVVLLSEAILENKQTETNVDKLLKEKFNGN